MEKELLIFDLNIQASFFYEEFEFPKDKLNEFKSSIKRTMRALNQINSFDENIVLNINLCSAKTITNLNKEYRHKEKETDVLSFPLQEDYRSHLYDSFDGSVELGDIFICDEVCHSQALEHKIEYFDEFIHLLVHGVLHLLGYDHEAGAKEEELMQNLESKIIDHISKNDNQ